MTGWSIGSWVRGTHAPSVCGPLASITYWCSSPVLAVPRKRMRWKATEPLSGSVKVSASLQVSKGVAAAVGVASGVPVAA